MSTLNWMASGITTPTLVKKMVSSTTPWPSIGLLRGCFEEGTYPPMRSSSCNSSGWGFLMEGRVMTC